MKQASTALRNAAADALAGYFDGGTLEIYTGAQPASADDPPSGTRLLALTLPSPAFAAADGGEAAKAGAWEALGEAAGNGGWFRLSGSAGNVDGEVTGPGGGGELVLDNLSIAPNQKVVIESFTLSLA